MEYSRQILTSKERVFNRLQGKPVDKIPNLNITMTFAARHIWTNYKAYVNDYHCLVEANIRCCKRFGIDMLSAISDPLREAHDFGANVIFPDDDVPYCKNYLIKDLADIKKLSVQDPIQSIRMGDRIKAIEQYKRKSERATPSLGGWKGHSRRRQICAESTIS